MTSQTRASARTAGARDSISEHAKRFTWQPVRLGYDDAGVLTPVEYDRFETGDETTGESYYCRDCGAEWPTMSALGHAQRIRKAFTDWRDHYETRAERLKDLAIADRLDTVDGAEKIAEADGAARAFAHALAILNGNGEA